MKTKKGYKLQAYKKITTKSFESLHQDFQKLHNPTISYGSFINLKLFYISRLTEKETEMCLCSKCLNHHCLYKTIKSTVDSSLPNSLSEYLCKSINCHKEPEADFYSRECILGQCQNNCKITNISNDLKNYLVTVKSKKAHYYIYETVQTQQNNKNGKLESYTRTAHVNKHDTIESIISQL